MGSTRTREVPSRPAAQMAGNETRETAASGTTPANPASAGANQQQAQSTQQPQSTTHSSSPGIEQQVDTNNAAPVTRPAVTEERIRELAYQKWQTAGCPEGDGVEFWIEAEAELYNIQQSED